MKKMIVLILALFVVENSVQAQFSTLWQKKSGGTGVEALPTWFTAGNNNVRCLAYGNNHLYLVQRNSGVTVKIVSPTDGSDITELSNGSGIISGGTFTMNDVEVSSNGEIFVCNLTTNASTSAFKVYRWTSEGGTPTNVISYTGITTRLGDYMTIVGSTADNSAVIYVPSASTSTIVKFTTSDNGASWSGTTITVSDVAMGTGPCVAPVGTGSANFIVKSSGQNYKEYDNAGTYLATLPGGIVATGNTSVKYFEYSGNKYVATVKYGATATDNLLNLANITAGTASATLYGSSVSLGTYNNSANGGDVAFKDNGSGNYTLFIVSPGNGFGAFTTTTDPLPVELASFTSKVVGGRVDLAWSTATEKNNYGFEIERKNTSGEFSKIGFVEGNGTTLAPHSYSYKDNVPAGVYSYRLKQLDRDGKFSYSTVIEARVTAVVDGFAVVSNYPNPFNSTTNFEIRIPEKGNVRLAVYDLLGREVARLMNGTMNAGVHRIQWTADNIPSGTYIYRLESGSSITVNRLVLIK